MNFKDVFVGVRVYGFCNGYFGSSSYDDKTIIASGENWIVGKTDCGEIEFASFDDGEDMKEFIMEWSDKINEGGW